LGTSDGESKNPSGLGEEAPHYHGHRQRLRARFLEAGADAVSDYELIELILFRAIPQRDLKPLAKDLIARFGSFDEVVSAPIARLREVKGLGEAAIAELKIVQASASRLARGAWRRLLDAEGSDRCPLWRASGYQYLVLCAGK
jgi:DNA repair protein RadC